MILCGERGRDGNRMQIEEYIGLIGVITVGIILGRLISEGIVRWIWGGRVIGRIDRGSGMREAGRMDRSGRRGVLPWMEFPADEEVDRDDLRESVMIADGPEGKAS